MKKLIYPVLSVLATASYTPGNAQVKYPQEAIDIERMDADLDKIIDKNVRLDIIAQGYQWSEGPLWVEQENMLLFSDVPTNKVYKWTEKDGATVYLNPSGYTATAPLKSKEPGSNGLLLDLDGSLVLCQHGDRRIARMDAPLNNPKSSYVTLVDAYQSMRFNSPNDAVYAEDGSLYFTDPPYGLPSQGDDDPMKELAYNGVYRLGGNGDLTLLTDALSRPNGIAVFPDGDKILISNSDGRAAAWYLLNTKEATAKPVLFYDATEQQKGVKGLPDGLKIRKDGTVLASGPGGVYIFSINGKLLGKIKLKDPVSNVALSSDEKYMFLTNTARVLRIKML